MLFADLPVIQISTAAVIGFAATAGPTIAAAIWKGADRLVAYLERKDAAHAAERDAQATAHTAVVEKLIADHKAELEAHRADCGENQKLIVSLLREKEATK